MNRILIVDDEEKMCRLLKSALSDPDYEVDVCTRGMDAINLCRIKDYQVVITDLRMPDVDGLQVLKEIKGFSTRTEVIMITAYGTTQDAVEAMKMGACDYIVKPFDLDEFRIRVSKIIERKNLEYQKNQLQKRLEDRYRFDNIVGRSEKMKTVFQLIDQVATTDATVLITGESGTGKQLVARAIHYNSPRSEKPLVEVHCAALPEGLLESELFGHEKGAFTGAVSRKPGRFELARGGTIFLDEIGEISTAIQVKLLRFLQEKELVRLGGTETIKVDVRVIAATNRDLQKAIQEGKFREDLFYRLNIFPIHMPPLREMKSDIPELIQHFLNRHGLTMKKVKPEVIRLLQKYNWPGNVRELENVIERCIIISGDGQIEPSMLPENIREASMMDQGLSIPEEGICLDEVERNLIREALRKSGGNKTAAAKLLGITRRRLYSKMESLGISPPEEEKQENG